MRQHKGIALPQSQEMLSFWRQLHFMEDKDIIQRNMCLIMEPLAPATMIEL